MDDERYIRITLRIPKELHAQLAESAEQTSKSMNAEIVARLDASFADSSRTQDGVTLDQIRRLLDERDARMLAEVKALLKHD